MKYSIRKKMFLITMATTILSFLLVLICFNYISNNYIERESIKELTYATSNVVSQAKVVTAKKIDSLATTTNYNVVVSEKESSDVSATTSVAQSVMIKEIHGGLQSTTETNDVDFILMGPSNHLIYPAEPVTKSNSISISKLTPAMYTPYYNTKEVDALKEFSKETDFNQPTRASLNDSSYYILKTHLEDGTSAIFYKNVQSLDKLVSDVNLTLFILLLLSSLLTIVGTMGFTNGMVTSIQKLCHFANAIGEGEFKQQSLNLKEKELSVLAHDMNGMAKRLSDNDTEQKIFFQNVSHELRTPLMSIQGYAEGISSHVFENEKAEKAANIILDESSKLADMVDDLLYLSRMDSKEYHHTMEDFNLLDEVESVIQQGASLSGNKRIIFHKDGDLFSILGNQEELGRALLNVLTNGIRYAASEVTINCHCKKRLIQIIDDGPGIEAKDLPHIFKRFYKGTNGCSGIGLAIAETVVKKHNGTITATNDHGATFTIALP